jgi:hypothetical protein
VLQQPAATVHIAFAGLPAQDHAVGGAAGDVLLGLLGQLRLARAASPAAGLRRGRDGETDLAVLQRGHGAAVDHMGDAWCGGDGFAHPF